MAQGYKKTSFAEELGVKTDEGHSNAEIEALRILGIPLETEYVLYTCAVLASPHTPEEAASECTTQEAVTKHKRVMVSLEEGWQFWEDGKQILHACYCRGDFWLYHLPRGICLYPPSHFVGNKKERKNWEVEINGKPDDLEQNYFSTERVVHTPL